METARPVMAEFLHHDVQDSGRGGRRQPDLPSSLGPLGHRRQGVEFVGYWDNAPAAGPAGRPGIGLREPQQGQGPAGLHPRRHRHAAGFEVTLNLDRMGLMPGRFTATDLETLEPLRIGFPPGDVLPLELGPGAVRLVALEETK